MSDAREGDNSVILPSPCGIQGAGFIPIGMYTKPKRRTGFAAAGVIAESAGTIASNKGNDNVTPIPRRNVRRGRTFFVTIIS